MYGSTVTNDTIAAMEAADTITNYSPEETTAILDHLILTHEIQVREQMSWFVTFSPVREWQGAATAGSTLNDQERTEGGRAPLQKNTYDSQTAGIGLRAFETATGWTYESYLMTSGGEYIRAIRDHIYRDVLRLQKALRVAFYTPTNTTVTDHLLDGRTLYVKALANGDSWAYPPDQFGNAVATHNHYLGYLSGAFAVTDLNRAQNHLSEHFPGWKVIHIFNKAQETTVRAFVGVTGAQFEGVKLGADTTTLVGIKAISFDDFMAENYCFGRYQGCELWVKPWAYANYMITMIVPRKEEEKVLRYRYRGGNATLGGSLPFAKTIGVYKQNDLMIPAPGVLRPAMGEDGEYPKDAYKIAYFEREFGMGAQNRLGAVVTYLAANTYTAPTIV